MKRKIIVTEKQMRQIAEAGSIQVNVPLTSGAAGAGQDLTKAKQNLQNQGVDPKNATFAIDGDSLNEDYGANVREYSNKLIGLMDDGTIDPYQVACALIDYMSEDDVKDFCRLYEYSDFFDDEDSDIYEHVVITKKQLKEARRKQLRKNSKVISKKEFLNEA